jgi:hypothetical protein
MGAIVRLRDRYANDEIGLDEFSRAVDGVLAARARQELSRASPSGGPPVPVSRVSWLGAEALQRHLAPGEEIVWVGRPEGRLNLTPGELRMTAPCLGMGVFLESVSASMPGPTSAAQLLMPLGICGVGLYFMGGRSALQARGAVYAVTTRRIVRMTRRSRGEQMDSKLLIAIPDISVTERRGGRGTVTFGEGFDVQPRRWHFGSELMFRSVPINFVNITDAPAVARLIESLRAYQQSWGVGRPARSQPLTSELQ